MEASQHLPSEIISEILPRLPVQTLLKFRCVCKSWLSLISSSEFIKTHLKISRNSTNYANHSLILGSREKPYSTFTCSLSSILDNNAHVNPKDLYHPNPALDFPICIYGNCNGLLLHASSALDLPNKVLYNPTTRNSKLLPDPGTNNSFFLTYGLCYHESDDDYRVVELNTIRDRDHNHDFVHEVKIYSLRTNSWRKINHDFRCSEFIRTISVDGVVDQTDTQGYVNIVPGIPVGGVLHWPIRVEDIKLCQIFAVDTGTYTYATLAIPKYDNIGRPEYSGIMDFGGCLGVYHDFSKTGIDIWTMRESWTKVLTVPYGVDPGVDQRFHNWPLVGLKDGEILLQSKIGYSMVYNSREDSFINQVIPGHHVPTAASSPVYIESLVAPSFSGESHTIPLGLAK